MSEFTVTRAMITESVDEVLGRISTVLVEMA
jgi:hypothetical protein